MQIEARICDENKDHSRKYGDPNVKPRFISKNISYKFHKLAHEFLKMKLGNVIKSYLENLKMVPIW